MTTTNGAALPITYSMVAKDHAGREVSAHPLAIIDACIGALQQAVAELPTDQQVKVIESMRRALAVPPANWTQAPYELHTYYRGVKGEIVHQEVRRGSSPTQAGVRATTDDENRTITILPGR
jgi:hypothetical protein